jgi:integrase
MDITKVTDRRRLPSRREPYWRRVRRGCYIGYRAGSNTWIARVRSRQGEQHYKALGDANTLSFDDAVRSADHWVTQLASHATRTPKRGAVTNALAAYVDWLRDNGRESTAKDAQGRFKLLVDDDPISTERLEDLTREDVVNWRNRIKNGRKPRTVNRHVRAVVAALNQSLRLGFTGNPVAWRLEPLSDADDRPPGAEFLDATQRQLLISVAPPRLGAFLRVMSETGARPGEIAKAQVRDFDPRSGTLTLTHKKGRPVRVRTRVVILPEDAVAFFNDLVRDRQPNAPLCPTSTNIFWDRHSWAKLLREAITVANETIAQPNVYAIDSDTSVIKRIPKKVSAYTFRHSRISELLQHHHVDPMTVALQMGTSVEMIERHYFRFLASSLRSKLGNATGLKLA